MSYSGVNSISTAEYIKKAKEIHGNSYNYSKTVYKNARTKVNIICKKHGMFDQRPNSHLNGLGCSVCRSSKGELKIIKFLKSNKIKYIKEKTFKGCINPKTNGLLRYDFYIPSANLLIEFDGAQHFQQTWLKKFVTSKADLKSIQQRDKIKNNFAIKKGIDILRIPYTKIESINKILTNKLLLCHSKSTENL